MTFDPDKAQDFLHDFELQTLFVQGLGWSNPRNAQQGSLEVAGKIYQRQRIAQMSDCLPWLC